MWLKNSKATVIWLATVFFVGVATAASSPLEAQCASLAQSLQLENTSVWFTQYVTTGTNLTFPDNDPTCNRRSQAVSADICRVALLVKTSDRSNISMEAWLPSNWTGRFLSTGNGGLSGCIQYEDMAYTSGLGFATVGANSGHNGTSGAPFYNNPEVVNDWGYRSVHTNVVIGKAITQQYYGQPHTKSYYLGCSTGGRQGFKTAQTFPDDFDGIVAGAPAVGFTNLTVWSGNFLRLTGTVNSSSFVPFSLWPTIHQSILEQCDALDGAADGILEDPLLCSYRPEALLCPSSSASPGTNTSTPCLTPDQAYTVRQIFSPVYGNGGSLVYPRMQPGSELNGAPQRLYSGTPFPYTTDWFRYAVYNDPTWDPYTLSLDDFDNAYRVNSGDAESWADLAAFRASGGKLLHYHGLVDPLISSDNSARFYDFISRSMGLGSSALDDFYRYFRIAGMSHCAGGNGAWEIGQTGAGAATLDPEGNVLMAVVRWVEEGVAPETIRGTKYVNDTPALGAQIVRAHCRYPFRNVYVGSGEVGEEGSWRCVEGF